MRRNLVAIVSAGAAMTLAACNSDRPTSPGLSPRAALAGKNPPTTCEIQTVKSDAAAFFASSGDPVYTMIDDMKTLLRTSIAAATPKGFDILARVAGVRYTSAQKTGSTAANGATFVNDVLKCMDVGTVPSTFNAELALDKGVFEVRGDASGAPAALAYSGTAGGAKVQYSPRWGVEPKTPAGWPTASGAGSPRFLIFGYPITTTDFGGETPTDGFNAFEVGTLRADVAKGTMRVGVCTHLVVVDPINTTKAVAANLLIHDNVVVQNESPDFCAGLAAAPTKSTWLTRLASVFTPTIAFAQDGEPFSRDFIGGGPSSWSPMKFGKVAGTDMNLTFTTQPKNTGITPKTIPSFTVHAASAAGHAIPGVTVTIKVFGNNGVPADAIIVAGHVSKTTDASGNVTFDDIELGKAGGYTLTALGSLGGVGTNSKVSALFNVKNK